MLPRTFVRTVSTDLRSARLLSCNARSQAITWAGGAPEQDRTTYAWGLNLLSERYFDTFGHPVLLLTFRAGVRISLRENTMEAEVDRKRQPCRANDREPSGAGFEPNAFSASKKRRSLRSASLRALLLPLLVAMLLGSILLSLSVGAVHIQTGVLLRTVFTHNELTPTEQVILLQVRLPRIISSAIVGSCLSVSGLLFQGLFRNPMADPYVIGASGGSVLGACLGIFLLRRHPCSA